MTNFGASIQVCANKYLTSDTSKTLHLNPIRVKGSVPNILVVHIIGVECDSCHRLSHARPIQRPLPVPLVAVLLNLSLGIIVPHQHLEQVSNIIEPMQPMHSIADYSNSMEQPPASHVEKYT